MSRAALALLLLAPLLAAALTEAQAPAGFAIPTQKDLAVGGLNVTLWVLRDTRTITYTPDARENPLAYLWNLNFTAGSLGVLYLKGTVREPGEYALEARVHSSSPLFRIDPTPAANGSLSSCRPIDAPNTVRCTLGLARNDSDHAFQFVVAASAPAGPMPMTIQVTALRNTTEGFVAEGRQDASYELRVVDAIPPAATRAQAGNDTTVAAWVNAGPGGVGATGCLAGAALTPDSALSQGVPATVCVIAVTRSRAEHRLVARVEGASWLVAPPNDWTSPPFNATTGGLDMPVNGFTVQTNGVAPLGASTLRVPYTLEQDQGGAWVAIAQGQLEVPFSVAAGVVLRGERGPNWLAQAPLLLASVAGLGYLAYANRAPRLQPRSQAMQAELARKSKRRDDEPGASAASAEQVAQQRQDVQEAAWEKKRKILDAKRDDILKSIRIAEERHQRGEITEHVVKGIRERKERQLEQVQKELEELQE